MPAEKICLHGADESWYDIIVDGTRRDGLSKKWTDAVTVKG